MEKQTHLGAYYDAKRLDYRMSEVRREILLSLVPADARDILEIGCGRGGLARILQERGHEITGVDISSDALKEAAPFLKQGFAIDVEKKWSQTLNDMRFDAVIASEIIEHLFDPDHFLTEIHSVLRDGGSLILTTPNFLFWKNRIKMLWGRFKYEERGLLDFGHIRFFTLPTIRKAFLDNGFAIDQEVHYYPNLLHRKLNFIGKYFPGLFAYQLIFLCRKA